MRLRLSDDCELRPLEEADAEELYALIDANRAHLSRWMWWAPSQTLDGTREFIRAANRRLDGGEGLEAVIVCGGALAGVIGVEIDRAHRSASVGYWLGERHQGRGTMTRAVGAVVEHALTAWQLNRIEIRAAPENARSRAIPQRLGFREEATLRETDFVGDRFLDGVVYSRLASDRD